MSRLFSLAWLTVSSLSPPDAVRLAKKLGYDAVGLRIAPSTLGGACAPLIEDKALLAATRAVLEQTGVAALDMEIVRIGADFAMESVRPFLETSAALGARAVLVAGDDPDENRFADRFAAFCAAAAPYDLTADLEFMPWTRVPDAKTATRIVERAEAVNGRVLVDALHYARSATTLHDIDAIPRARLGYAQICDAPGEAPTTAEGLIHTARVERLLPGEGGIDLLSLFARLPATLPVSVEVPNEKSVAAYGAQEWARRALAAARRTLALAESR